MSPSSEVSDPDAALLGGGLRYGGDGMGGDHEPVEENLARLSFASESEGEPGDHRQPHRVGS